MIGTQIQNYRIISSLGEGGMGKVFKAFDIKLERYVAIKFLSPNLLSDHLFLERFRNEGKNHAKLSHPNIVMVYGFLEYRDLMGLIIEYVEGITIENLILKYKRLNLIYSLKIIRQILIALEYAHSKGLIHRDIKPSNIIIDKNGVAKLMDFGISKSLDSKTDLTTQGRNIGTILYMSPEQINNQQTTPKTDLYSLAITLYEMISGNPPYLYDNYFKIYNAHLNQKPPRLSARFQDIPDDVDELILSAMNKSASNNFSSAIEFRKAVEELIFSLPVRINQISSVPIEKFEKTKRINRHILIPAFLILAFIFLAGASYLFVKSYLPQEKENISEQNLDFDLMKKFNRSDWERIPINSSENFNDIIFFNNNFYLSNSKGSLFIIDKDFNIKELTNLGTGIINKILFFYDKIFLLSNDGKIILSNSDFSDLKVFEISNETILSGDLKSNQLFFCGTNGLIGKIDIEKMNVKIFEKRFNSDLLDIKIIDNNTIIAVGWDGNILYTTDSGSSWSRKNLSKNYLKKIAYHSDVNSIFISGSGGVIYNSQDKGNNWKEINLEITSTINDFLFFDLKNYYAVNSSGDILITTDAGKTWSFKKTEYFVPLNKILNVGENLYIIGNNGLFIRKKI